MLNRLGGLGRRAAIGHWMLLSCALAPLGGCQEPPVEGACGLDSDCAAGKRCLRGLGRCAAARSERGGPCGIDEDCADPTLECVRGECARGGDAERPCQAGETACTLDGEALLVCLDGRWSIERPCLCNEGRCVVAVDLGPEADAAPVDAAPPDAAPRRDCTETYLDGMPLCGPGYRIHFLPTQATVSADAFGIVWRCGAWSHAVDAGDVMIVRNGGGHALFADRVQSGDTCALAGHPATLSDYWPFDLGPIKIDLTQRPAVAPPPAAPFAPVSATGSLELTIPGMDDGRDPPVFRFDDVVVRVWPSLQFERVACGFGCTERIEASLTLAYEVDGGFGAHVGARQSFESRTSLGPPQPMIWDVPGTPVVFTTQMGVDTRVAASAEGAIDYAATTAYSGQINAGFVFTRDGTLRQTGAGPERPEGSGLAIRDGVEIHAGLSATVEVTPWVRLLLYDLLGPQFSVTGSATGTVALSAAGDTFESSLDACGRAQIAVRLQALGVPLAEQVLGDWPAPCKHFAGPSACLDECDRAEPARCVGAEQHTCGDFDDDPCADRQRTPCPDGCDPITAACRAPAEPIDMDLPDGPGVPDAGVPIIDARVRCEICLIADANTGACVADPAQEAQPCGPSRVCELGLCVDVVPPLPAPACNACQMLQNNRCVPDPARNGATADCGAAWQCQNGQCVDTCSVLHCACNQCAAGVCQTTCQAGATRCTGNRVEQCSADGCGWVAARICPHACVDAGRCVFDFVEGLTADCTEQGCRITGADALIGAPSVATNLTDPAGDCGGLGLNFNDSALPSSTGWIEACLTLPPGIEPGLSFTADVGWNPSAAVQGLVDFPACGLPEGRLAKAALFLDGARLAEDVSGPGAPACDHTWQVPGQTAGGARRCFLVANAGTGCISQDDVSVRSLAITFQGRLVE